VYRRILYGPLAAVLGLAFALAAKPFILGEWVLGLGILLAFALPLVLLLLRRETLILVKGIASGTLFGLIGPIVLFPFGTFDLPFNSFSLRLSQQMALMLEYGVPSLGSALISSLLARWSRLDSRWPYGLLGGIVLVSWGIYAFSFVVDWGYGSLLIISAIWAGSWMGGWNAIQVVRKAPIAIAALETPAFSAGFQDRFTPRNHQGSEHICPQNADFRETASPGNEARP
jgi:hypothetical protein